MNKKHLLLILLHFLTLQLFSQGGENGPDAASAPISIPFSENGTTVGKNDDYNNIKIANYLGFTLGPDWLYYFCANETTVIYYKFSFTPDPVYGVYPSFSVWQSGVPGVGTPIVENVVAGKTETNMSGSFVISKGQCYYIMVDNWPGYNGFAYNLTLTLPPAEPILTAQPSCTNIGFDNGNFSGWTGGWGNTVTTNFEGKETPVFYPSTYNTSTSQHTITSGTEIDPIAGFPTVCPGLGPNSVRLGDINNFTAPNNTYPNKGGAMLEQKFAVTPSNALLTYHYAAVVQDAINPVYLVAKNGGDSLDASGKAVPMPNYNKTGDSIIHHYSNEQPFFKVELFDNNNVLLNCGNFLVVGGPGVPGFKETAPGSSLYFKTWSPMFIDLSPFIGTNVKIKFTVGDCSKGGHFAYAYIDAVCEPMVSPPPPVSICAKSSTTLTSPLNGLEYSWINILDPTTILGTSKTLTVSPKAAINNYKCIVTAASGCSTNLSFTVNVYPETTINSTSTSICFGKSGTLTATGSPVGGYFSWAPIGGTAATTTTLSPTTTTTYTCTYTDPNGCVATGSGTITVLPLPVVEVNSQTVCPNSPAILTATGANSYVWDANSSLTANPYTVNPTSTTVYNVVGTGANGCIASASATVTVSDVLVITVNSPSICIGGSAILTASGATTYSWDEGSNLAVSTLNPFSVSPNKTTTYTVTGSKNGCFGKATSTVTVNTTQPIVASSNSPICSNSDLNLTVSSSDVTGSKYSWTGPNGFTSENQNPTIFSATSAAAGSYTVTLSNNSCVSTSTVNVLIIKAPTTIAASTPVCSGTNLLLTSSDSGIPGSTYNWTGPNGFISTDQNPTIKNASIAASGTYIVTVTANGCSSKSTINTVVNPPRKTNIQILPDVICEGSNVPVLIPSSIDNPSITGIWNPSHISNTLSSTYTFTPDFGQCASIETKTINVRPSPHLVIKPPEDICAPNRIDLTSTSVTFGSSGESVLSYWSDSTCTIPLVSASSISSSGTFFIKSSDLVCSVVLPVSVSIHPKPIASFSALPSELSTVKPFCILQNNSFGADNYVWNFGDNSEISTLTNPDHFFPDDKTGKYTISLVASSQFGCVDTAYVSVFVNEELIFYVPNTFTPDDDDFNNTFQPIFTSGIDPLAYTLYIFNRWGELLFESHDSQIGWDGTYGKDNIVCKDDVYTWKIIYKLKTNGQQKVAFGHVNILK
jgi:gliding motility-associated-like protein